MTWSAKRNHCVVSRCTLQINQLSNWLQFQVALLKCNSRVTIAITLSRKCYSFHFDYFSTTTLLNKCSQLTVLTFQQDSMETIQFFTLVELNWTELSWIELAGERQVGRCNSKPDRGTDWKHQNSIKLLCVQGNRAALVPSQCRATKMKPLNIKSSFFCKNCSM